VTRVGLSFEKTALIVRLAVVFSLKKIQGSVNATCFVCLYVDVSVVWNAMMVAGWALR